jgi:hypothetical protein
MTMTFSLYPSAASEDTQFVTRSGSALMLKGASFRFAGSNMTWLGLTEDDGIHYPSHAEIDSAIADAEAMGATVVRSHAVLSVGCSLCIEPTLGVFNDGTSGKPNAFDSIDYAVAVAKHRNIRLLFPLVDNYNYYLGGKFTYLSWRGIAADQVGSQFFTNLTVRSDFERHIAAVLNHVNPYTGLAYKNEPAILAWETGNELAAYPNTWSYSGWTDAISTYIKRGVGARQLVASGQYGIYTINSTIDTTGLGLANVDLYSNHAYDNWRSPSEIAHEARVVTSYEKGFFLGEYSWTDNDVNGARLSWTLPEMLSSIETSSVAGDLIWQLLPNGVHHNDGFTLHRLSNTGDTLARVTELQEHAFVMCPLGAECRTPPLAE